MNVVTFKDDHARYSGTLPDPLRQALVQSGVERDLFWSVLSIIVESQEKCLASANARAGSQPCHRDGAGMDLTGLVLRKRIALLPLNISKFLFLPSCTPTEALLQRIS